MLERFKADRYCEGLCLGVERLGEQLRAHSPLGTDDRNELSDDVSIGR